jgi:uncharacterized membrane protein YqaE (UPF0057 family)
MNLLKLVLAVFFPPLAMLLHVGLTKHFWINILLTLLGFVPGIIHAFIIILRDE